MKPIINKEMVAAATDALSNERFVLGESVSKFEDEFARYIGTEYAVSVSSGTNALAFSMLALGVKDKEVITTSASFIATSNSILHAGASPVFADIDLKTYTLNPKEVEKNVSRKTKVILPVHLYGYPADMEEILRIADKYNLSILEDACQSHGAVYKDRMTGNLGAAAAFSFYSSKNMTVCGDGGMITTNDPKIAEITRSLRDSGRSKEERYLHERIGYTARMNNVNAAIGRVQLRYLEEWNEKRRKVARDYNKRLDGIGDLILPPKEDKEIKPVWHLYVIRTKRRNLLKKYLEENQIECGVHYPIPIHMQPPYIQMGFKEGMFPNTELWAREVLSIPLHPNLMKEEMECIVDKIDDFFRGVR